MKDARAIAEELVRDHTGIHYEHDAFISAVERAIFNARQDVREQIAASVLITYPGRAECFAQLEAEMGALRMLFMYRREAADRAAGESKFTVSGLRATGHGETLLAAFNQLMQGDAEAGEG